jgi:hypothetical protein
VTDITNKERGLGPTTKMTNRGSSPGTSTDAGTVVSAGAAVQQPRYWNSDGRVYRIVLNGYKFDFKPPAANQSTGSIEGRVMASGHNGSYALIKNEPGNFQIKVRIGTDKDPTADVNATLTVVGQSARIEGTLKGEAQKPEERFGVSELGSNHFELVGTKNSLEWLPRD